MTAAVPRPASTVALLRMAGSRLEVFLVRRHDTIAFMGGAHVFPGGRVDETDRLRDPHAVCDDVEGAVRRLDLLSPEEAIASYVAAARELFEEAGVLLARRGGAGMVSIDGDTVDRFDSYRRALVSQALSVRDVLEREGLRLALDALALAAHWVTPEIEAKRFDTRFFFALAPQNQGASHDVLESTSGAWFTPADAVERCRRGDIALPPPTWTTLRLLSRFDTAEEAWTWAQTCPVPRIEPGFVVREDGMRLVTLPGDPLCPPVEGFHAEETRFLLKDGRWTVVEPSP